MEPPPVIAEQNGEQNNQKMLAFEESTERQTQENKISHCMRLILSPALCRTV
jgi:hypothetical protein